MREFWASSSETFRNVIWGFGIGLGVSAPFILDLVARYITMGNR